MNEVYGFSRYWSNFARAKKAFKKSFNFLIYIIKTTTELEKQYRD